MATKAAPKAAPEEGAAPKKKSKLLIIIIAAVILLGGGGGAAWFFLFHKAAPEHEAKPVEAVAKPPVFMPMETFTVNLQGETGEQFLQTSFTLQVADQAQVETIKLYMPHVRSRLLLLLSGKKASEILTTEGKNKLSQEIIELFKQPFVPGAPKVEVTSVLFTSFVVQ